MPNYGLISSAGVPRPALDTVLRWNDGVKRHTLFTVCGTVQDAWGLTPTGTRAPSGVRSFDTAMGTDVDPQLFEWVPVTYPASFPTGGATLDDKWNPLSTPFQESVRQGVNELISLINATPGTFALSGNSQGSIVISQVLKQLLPGGSLSSRYNDCIGAVAFANPCRKAGWTFPGGTPPPGAGMFSLINDNSPISGLAHIKLPTWWWEMATPDDFFADAPMNTPLATAMTAVAKGLATFRGVADPLKMIGSILDSLTRSGGTFAFLVVLLSGILTFGGSLWGMLMDWVGVQTSYPANPHILYGLSTPPTLPDLPGLPENPTYVEVGVAYLNARGAEVAPR